MRRTRNYVLGFRLPGRTEKIYYAGDGEAFVTDINKSVSVENEMVDKVQDICLDVLADLYQVCKREIGYSFLKV